MEIGQDALQTLSAVLREGTFEAAATVLHITPSAVSQRIKALERSVGRVLVRRTKPVRATRDGEVLVRLAEQWELLVTEAGQELAGSADGPPGTDRPLVHLPIAANADSLATWLLPALADFHRNHAAAVEVRRDDESRNSEYLRTGEVLGALTSIPDRIRGCRVQPLGSMRYLPVATPDFLATWMPDGPTDAALARAPMMLFDRSDQLQRDVLRILTDTPGDPPGVYIPGSVEYHRAIELGMGWGAAPTVQIAGALADGRLVRFTDRHVDVPLYWQYWTVSSPLLTALTDYIADAAATHLDPVGHLSPQARAPR
ncbi:LysR family transcriptional regulator ArgP [Gordonia desulfuricans]|uniref:LysR family transcriptional regulator ArgP n=1 Tax=Gordonia desulfuricans TaxID=89051 RepID=A0A7K3LK44_9ACTN|nr:LysR family transcriptional regulator ArgP [Gordonia desulfuricans]NDK88594.1 LysR family transcriptional regulator ArgP [Gordonia desulfuricans]